MCQERVLHAILPGLKEDPAVRAVFLKGSMARGDADSYSDLDLYCLVAAEEMEAFLSRRKQYIKEYRPILFWSEVDFVGPQIVAVYDDGLHLDLYTVTEKTLQESDEIRVLYDPDSLLVGYKNRGFYQRNEDIVACLNSFSFGLLEFETAFKRGDLVWASRLGSHLSGNLALLLRYVYDGERGKLGMKGLYKHIDEGMLCRFEEALDSIGPSRLPAGVKKLIALCRDIQKNLPEECNWRFFEFMAERIDSL